MESHLMTGRPPYTINTTTVVFTHYTVPSTYINTLLKVIHFIWQARRILDDLFSVSFSLFFNHKKHIVFHHIKYYKNAHAGMFWLGQKQNFSFCKYYKLTHFRKNARPRPFKSCSRSFFFSTVKVIFYRWTNF